MSSSTFEEWKEPKSLFPEVPRGAGTGADICVILQPLLQPQSELKIDARIYFELTDFMIFTLWRELQEEFAISPSLATT